MVIAGCGFLGEAAAVLFSETAWSVLGICASRETADRLVGRPFEVRAVDLTGDLAGIPTQWKQPEVLIHCASSGRGGADSYRSIYRDGLKNLIASFRPKRVIFTGSTSVYGQNDRALVTEISPAMPETETGKILLEAESLALEAGGVVARLAGIYGPGRSVYLRKFLDDTAVLEDGGERWVNMIHRDDAARALLKLVDPTVAPGIYNVCDDTPATQRDVYSWIASALDRPLPPEGPTDPHRKRGLTSKRVSNGKLRGLGWIPAFSSYADGIPGLLAR